MKRFLTFGLLLVFSVASLGQTSSNGSGREKRVTASAAATAAVRYGQPVDMEYTATITRNTTEPFFLTEIVDHLPAHASVPSPAKILGYPVGTPERLTYTADQYRYYKALDAATDRVMTFTAPEKSEQGREQLLIAVSDEANLENLARIKQITANLGDPRTLTEQAAAQLVAEGKAIYWASGSIHSTETGSPEMLMEMAYRLAVSEMPMIKEIRKNVIVLITPTLEVDGRDTMVDLYNWRKANPGKRSPGLIYWGLISASDATNMPSLRDYC